MFRPSRRPVAHALVGAALLSLACSAEKSAPPRLTRFEDLTALFAEWRTFQRPVRVNDVPDYSTAAMARQHEGLAAFRARLAAIDTTGWPVNQQVDWHLVRAEMNGLDFDHRVLRPWANHPSFYVTVFDEQSDQPAREGHYADGGVELWQHAFPLSAASAAVIDSGIRRIPVFLEQAQQNLTGTSQDLWNYGARGVHDQAKLLAELGPKLAGAPGTLAADVLKAKEATEKFAAWLDAQAKDKTGPSGIGVANYDWYLAHVQLAPHTWAQETAIMERELARSQAALALEELHNARLAQPPIVSSPAEHAARFAAGVTEYMGWLTTHQIMTIEPWMTGALRARVGSFNPGPREFFTEVDYRDPEVMRTHGYHWFDLGRMVHHPHPDAIRRGALLYNIFVTRTEGFATGWEEVMMHAGMFDARPRSRELIYILLAERAARALGDLAMQGRGFTVEQASQLASDGTPRGWLSMKGNLVRGEQHMYLAQPGYGTSYVVGKLQLDLLLAERKAQLGDQFTMKQVMDEVNAAGLIPASLLRWELTGKLPADVKAMLDTK